MKEQDGRPRRRREEDEDEDEDEEEEQEQEEQEEQEEEEEKESAGSEVDEDEEEQASGSRRGGRQAGRGGQEQQLAMQDGQRQTVAMLRLRALGLGPVSQSHRLWDTACSLSPPPVSMKSTPFLRTVSVSQRAFLSERFVHRIRCWSRCCSSWARPDWASRPGR